MPIAERPPPPRNPAYRVYIDECGDHTYKKLDQAGSRFLMVLGVWFERQHAYAQYIESLDRLTSDVFGASRDEPILLHRKEIKDKSGRFGALKDPDTCRKFNERLLRLVETAKFTMVGVCIDKHRHQQQYPSPIDPYHYSLVCLIERYCKWLNERGTQGDAMAEKRGADADTALADVYRLFWEHGSSFMRKEAAQRALTSKSLKLSPKTNGVPGLQLADILAHPMRQWAMARSPDSGQTLSGFGRELASVAEAKFRRGQTGIDGFGLVWR